MAAIVLALGVLEIAYGERMAINGGQGWDGQAYTQWALDFPHQVVAHGLTQYYAQRVLPSAAIYYASRALGVAPTVRHAILAFQLLDLAMLVASALLYAHLATRVMKWRAPATWAGFAALFLCFANARHALYYPTLTDPTAFFLGMLLAWGYLARKPLAVWLAAAAGAWTWPAMPTIAMAMLVAPRPREPVRPLAWPRTVRWTSIALAAGGTALVLLVARAYYVAPVPDIGCDKFAAWVLRDWLVVTVPLVAAMLGVGGYLLAAQPRAWNVVAYVRGLDWKRTAAAIAGCVAIVGARAWWVGQVGTQGEGPTFRNQILCEHGNAMLRGPIWGPVHEVVYFGPIVIVAIFAWRRIAELAAEWGPAIVLALAMVLAFATGSQARQWIHLFPLLVAVAIAATETRWTRTLAIAFGAACLAWSKLWFHIGWDSVHTWFDSPDQRYYMHLGQWASDASYLWHLGAALVTAVPIAVLSWRWWRR
ncbi:MAG TPA: hypothetical protein VMJ10_03490 [Kofleriaceae bacterium]|nr:hypothetical protein [Kofleriaceae bacterium]